MYLKRMLNIIMKTHGQNITGVDMLTIGMLRNSLKIWHLNDTRTLGVEDLNTDNLFKNIFCIILKW